MKLTIIAIATFMTLAAMAAKAADDRAQLPLAQPTIDERTLGLIEVNEARKAMPVRETTGAAVRDHGILCHEVTVRTRQAGSTAALRKLYRCD